MKKKANQLREWKDAYENLSKKPLHSFIVKYIKKGKKYQYEHPFFISSKNDIHRKQTEI